MRFNAHQLLIKPKYMAGLQATKIRNVGMIKSYINYYDDPHIRIVTAFEINGRLIQLVNTEDWTDSIYTQEGPVPGVKFHLITINIGNRACMTSNDLDIFQFDMRKNRLMLQLVAPTLTICDIFDRDNPEISHFDLGPWTLAMYDYVRYAEVEKVPLKNDPINFFHHAMPASQENPKAKPDKIQVDNIINLFGGKK